MFNPDRMVWIGDIPDLDFSTDVPRRTPVVVRRDNALWLSASTVSAHVFRIYTKTGVHGRVRLALWVAGQKDTAVVTAADEWDDETPNPMLDPFAPEQPSGPLCEKEGIEYDTYGGEREWQCGRAGSVAVPSGRLLCVDHAGELGYGPKQEEYGFDPADGLSPAPGTEG